MQNKTNKQREALRRLVITSAMIALSIVLCRMLGIQPNEVIRIEISFLPVAVVGAMFGPIWSGAAYGIADFVGAALTTGVNPLITLSKIIFGVMMGVCLHKKRRGLVYIILFFIISGIIVDIACMTPIFVFWFGYAPKAALAMRALNFAANVPIRIVLYFLTERYLGRFIFKAQREKL